MAQADETPLDEVQWRSPQLVQQMGGIHTNTGTSVAPSSRAAWLTNGMSTVLPYFSESPFFDRTSNNATLSNQAIYNQNMYFVIQTRAAFEAHLRSMAGLEFMVVQDSTKNDTIRDHNGVWVISKQQRNKRINMEDEVVPLSSYFVVGENIYMAPTVVSVVESRLVDIIAILSELLLI